MAGQKSADLDDFALYFRFPVIYSLIVFPNDQPEKIKQYAAWRWPFLPVPQVIRPSRTRPESRHESGCGAL